MEGFVGFLMGIVACILMLIANYRAPVTYEMLNKAAQVCYINSNTKTITADTHVVNIECRNGAKFEIAVEDLRR